MKRLISVIVAFGVAAGSVSAFAAPDELSKQAIQRRYDRDQAAKAEMDAMMTKCRTLMSGQK